MTARPTARAGVGRGELRRGHVIAIAGSHCAASFAALGLPPYLSRLLPELGDPQARLAGLLYVLPTVCTALAGPVWGRLADRFGRKKLLVRAQLGLAGAFTLAAFATDVGTLVVALVAQGVLGGTYGASAGYLAAGLTGERLSGALTLMQGSARLALAAAPALAGLLATTLDVRQMYGAAALLPLVSALVTLCLPEPERERGLAAPEPDGDTAGDTAGDGAGDGAGDTDADGDAAERPEPARPGISVAGQCVAEGGFVLVTVVSFPYFLPLAGEVVPGVPTALLGVLFAAPHLCYLLGAAPALRLLRGRARPGLAAAYALAAASAVAHLVPVVVDVGPGAALALLVLGRLLLGGALICGLTSLSQLAAEAAVGRRPGRLFGTVDASSKAGAVLAGVSASALAGLGPGAPLAVAVTAGAVLALATAHVTTPGFGSPSRSSELGGPT